MQDLLVAVAGTSASLVAVGCIPQEVAGCMHVYTLNTECSSMLLPRDRISLSELVQGSSSM